MIDIPMFPWYVLKYPPHQQLILIQKRIIQTTKSTIIWILLYTFQFFVELSNSVWPVYFEFTTRTGNIGASESSWPEIYFWKRFLKNQVPLSWSLFLSTKDQEKLMLPPLNLSFKWVLWFFPWNPLYFFFHNLAFDQ